MRIFDALLSLPYRIFFPFLNVLRNIPKVLLDPWLVASIILSVVIWVDRIIRRCSDLSCLDMANLYSLTYRFRLQNNLRGCQGV